MKYLLGIDLGSSSVKVALVEADSGRCVATASSPDSEAPIKALQPGWAEQRPEDWWRYFKEALAKLKGLDEVAAVGISYQMHGLVCLDKDLQVLRDAVIWCDSRGVPYGEHAPIPGNFTAAKLAWVKEHEPGLFDKIRYIMLPGDWLALRLTGTPATTACGLSEMMLWDFRAAALSSEMMDHFGFPHDIIPPLVPTFAVQGCVGATAAEELGIPAGTPVAYRAGDQPNNAFSLGVLNLGEVAATAGTSGVVYGINECVDKSSLLQGEQAGSFHRINTFLHVNGTLGLMHCINGCGILNAWMRRNVAADLDYDALNTLAATAPAGSDGVCIIPFGNGAERVLENATVGCSLHGIDFNRHSRAHLLRATQEGVAFALMYGMELMGCVETIRAGMANMFLSPVFRETLANVSGAAIELYDTDGSVGAARGAGLGAGVYRDADDTFASLKRRLLLAPADNGAVAEAYLRWKSILEQQVKNSI